MFWNRLRKDVEGAAMVETVAVMFLLLLLTGGMIDFMNMFWQRNMLLKAVERGARIAAVSDPVASGLTTLDALNKPSGCEPGDPYPAGTFDCVCDGAAQSCTGSCGGFNETAMKRIVQGRQLDGCGLKDKGIYSAGMCDFFPSLTIKNVVVRYTSTGLGYCYRPKGPVPTITVSVKNVPLRHYFLAGLLGFSNMNISSSNEARAAPAQATITGEDLSYSAPN